MVSKDNVTIVRMNMARIDEKRLAQLSMPTNIKKVQDVRYREGNNKFHLLDIRYPKDFKETLPVIITIHGGGLFYGDKSTNRAYDAELASQGYLVFSLSYRLVPEVNLYDQIEDILFALRFIATLLPKYQGDPKQIYLTGDSAGAFLAVLVTLCLNSSVVATLFQQTPFNFEIQGLGLVSGMFKLTDETPFLKEIILMALGENYIDLPIYRYLDFKLKPDLEKLPPTYLTSSEGDFIADLTFDFTKLLKEHQVKYLHRHISKDQGITLPHIFQVLYPKEKHSQAVITEMLNFWKNNSLNHLF